MNPPFIESLDRCAALEGVAHWSEKTPAHVQNIEYIEARVSSSYFIHVVRNPYDVVASMYEAARDYPEIWGKRSIQTCCDRWNRDVEISLRHISKSTHLMLKYEEVNCSSKQSIHDLIRFLGLDNDRMQWDLIGSDANQLIKPREKWKANNPCGLSGYTSYKFERVLSEEQRLQVKDMIDIGLWESVSAVGAR